MRIFSLLAGLMLAILSSCAYTGGGDNPALRKFSLFSMLNGDDIRAKCGQTAGYERYRLVYNGLYEEQFRVYELIRGPKDGNVLKASVTNPANVAQVRLDDLLSPWRPVVAERFIKDAEFSGLTAALAQAGFYGRAPVGLDLSSDSFWWLAVGCKDGAIFFNAWRHPSPDLMTLPFVKPVLGLDETKVSLNPPRHPISHMPQMKSSDDDKRFNLKVGENGLFGVSRLF
jgi:hypothetical protein